MVNTKSHKEGNEGNMEGDHNKPLTEDDLNNFKEEMEKN